MPGAQADTVTILHFSDFVNVESGETEPVGGAARFLTAVAEHRDTNPLILFAGNAFAPSKSKNIFTMPHFIG